MSAMFFHPRVSLAPVQFQFLSSCVCLHLDSWEFTTLPYLHTPSFGRCLLSPNCCCCTAILPWFLPMSLGTYGVLCACLCELCAPLLLVLNALIASGLHPGFRKKLGHVEELSESSHSTRGWCGRGKESLSRHRCSDQYNLGQPSCWCRVCSD